MLTVVYSEKFISQLEKLSNKAQKMALKKIELFINNPKHPSLNTHKLNGVLSGFLSFSVDYQTRIVFEYGKDNEISFLNIGDHNIYR